MIRITIQWLFISFQYARYVHGSLISTSCHIILTVYQDEACTVQKLKLVQTVTSVLDPVRDTGRRGNN